MRSFLFKFLSLIFIPALLSACATTVLVDTWLNPDITIMRHHKLLLAYMSKNDTTRRLNEEVFSSELNRRCVAFMPSYTILPEGKRIYRQTMAKGLRILVRMPLSKCRRFGLSNGLPTDRLCRHVSGLLVSGAYPMWDMYGFFDGYRYYEPTCI